MMAVDEDKRFILRLASISLVLIWKIIFDGREIEFWELEICIKEVTVK
jgi:hypothetical protein